MCLKKKNGNGKRKLNFYLKPHPFQIIFNFIITMENTRFQYILISLLIKSGLFESLLNYTHFK